MRKSPHYVNSGGMPSNPSPKIFVFKIIALLFSLLVIILSFEITLRFYGPKYYRFNNQSYEYYTNPRGYHQSLRKSGNDVIYGLRYRTSPEGYRAPDDPSYESIYANDKEELILGLGDSFIFGRGVRYKDISLTLLEDLLNKNGYKTRVKNCAIVGADIDDIVKIYRNESYKKKYPLVIYGFVLNDFGMPEMERIVGHDFVDFNDPKQPFDPVREKSKLYNFIRYMLEKRRLHTITSEVYLNAFRGENAREGFDILRQLNEDIMSEKGRLVVVLFPLLYNFERYPFSEIHGKMALFCKEEGIPLLDLYSVFSRYKAEDLWVNPTDHHPNETADRIAAEELYRFLNENKLLDTLNPK